MNDKTREAAETIIQQEGALALLHTYFDDARAQGLPPHHAISKALGRLAREERLTVQEQ